MESYMIVMIGFTPEQAEAVLDAMRFSMNESLNTQTSVVR